VARVHSTIRGSWIDLDERPPIVRPHTESEDGVDVLVDAGQDYIHLVSLGSTVMSDSIGSNPSYEDCVMATTTSPVEEVEKLERGVTICSQTDEGHIARLQVERYNKDRKQITFRVLVWGG
jgi:hypothetical protein